MAGAMDAIRETREAIWNNGYRPLAVHTAKKGDPSTGKKPLGDKWQIGARKDPPEIIELGTVVAYALNTGILADGLRVIDLDIDDPDMIHTVSALAFAMLGSTILRTRCNSPRRLAVYRAAEGEPVKVAITGETHGKEVACKVEVLGRGQQFVGYGNHWSGAEVEWPGGGPANTPRASLPAVSDAQVNAFLAACVPVIGAKPIQVKPSPRKQAGAPGASPTAEQGDLFAALNVIANDGPPDWEAWNKIGMALWAATEGSDAGWELWSAWSAKHPAADDDMIKERWANYAKSPPTASGAGKIFALAVGNSPGWRKPSTLKGNGHAQEPYPLPIPPVMPPPPFPGDVPGDDDNDDDPETLNEINPPLPPAPPPAGLPPNQHPQFPQIICEDGEIVRMVREAEAHLANAPGLPVYQRGMLVQPYQNEYRDAAGYVVHSAGFATMTSTALMKLLARSANYLKWDGRLNGGQGAYKRINPPDKLVETVLFDRVDWPFDVVRGILSCPTMRPDGSILREPGFDPATRYYLMFPSDLVVPEIPDKPTKNDARVALIRLLVLLESYPFVNNPSKAVALCILMTQVLRCAMTISPMLAVSAKAPGTGKSHLVDLGSTMATGRTCPSMGAGSDKKETEKEIAAMLLSGVSFTIDNVSSDIDIPLLNRATSQHNLTVRVFGKLENVEVQNSGVIYMTGNNLAIIDEQRRRTVRCEMDAGLENPERREFDGDPIRRVLEDRGQYVADVLTIARAYHVSGEMVAPVPYGGYEEWSHFVREPLIWLGQADPLDTQDMTGKDDPATIRLHAMVEGWWGEFQDKTKTAAQAVVDADQNGFYQTLREQFPSKGGSEVDTTRMGVWLRKFSGRVSHGKRFIRDEGATGGAVRWKVEYV